MLRAMTPSVASRLVASSAEVDRELGVRGRGHLEPEPVPRQKSLRRVPHHHLDLVDLAGLDGQRALVAVAVAQPHQAVAEPLCEPVRVQIDELRSDVGVGRGGTDVQDRANRSDDVERGGQRLARVDEHVAARLDPRVVVRATDLRR